MRGALKIVAHEKPSGISPKTTMDCVIFAGKRVNGYWLSSLNPKLAEQFRDMLSVFSLDDSCSQTLYEIFQETWDLFRHISVDAFSRFLETLFPGDERVGGLLRGGVRLDPSPDLDDRFALSFFGERDWNAFSEEVKHEHRYLAEISNKEVLSSLFNALEKIVEPEDGSWYRARIWNDKRLQDINEKGVERSACEQSSRRQDESARDKLPLHFRYARGRYG